MTDNTEALPPLPEKRWAGFCGKCHSTTQFQKRPNTKAAPCGRCGYATFCEELDYSDDEMRTYARAALAQCQQVPEDKWEGAEEWMPLAWELCADECGEEACNELVWEGGPVPEPWGDRWLKYEGEAKRLIALVRKHVPALTAAPSAQHNTIRGDQMAQGQPQGATPGVTPGTEADRPTLSAPSAQPATREGCDYIAPLGSLCRKCGHVHGQRYAFWTGDGEAAMQPDPNGNWLWIGDPAKAPKGL